MSMNLYQLVDKVGGEIVRGVARVRRDNKYIVLGNVLQGEMAFSDAGRALVTRLTGIPVVSDEDVTAALQEEVVVPDIQEEVSDVDLVLDGADLVGLVTSDESAVGLDIDSVSFEE